MSGSQVPGLRFPGFDGEWEVALLEAALVSIDSGWSPTCLERSAEEGEWAVLKTTAEVWSGFVETANKALPIVLAPRTEIEVQPDDILITRAGPADRVGVVAHVSKVRSKLMLSDKLIRVRVKDGLSSHFVSVVLGLEKQQSFLSARKSGLAESQANISQKIVRAIPLSIPQFKEQQKVSEFLCATSHKLNLLTEKKTALEAYKRGVIQRLFSRALRFTQDDGSASRIGKSGSWVTSCPECVERMINCAEMS